MHNFFTRAVPGTIMAISMCRWGEQPTGPRRAYG